jgi:hypothetical protein
LRPEAYTEGVRVSRLFPPASGTARRMPPCPGKRSPSTSVL